MQLSRANMLLEQALAKVKIQMVLWPAVNPLYVSWRHATKSSCMVCAGVAVWHALDML